MELKAEREREREVAVPLRIRVSAQPNRRIIVGLLAGPVLIQ
jgi:hypothetical protein